MHTSFGNAELHQRYLLLRFCYNFNARYNVVYGLNSSVVIPLNTIRPRINDPKLPFVRR